MLNSSGSCFIFLARYFYEVSSFTAAVSLLVTGLVSYSYFPWIVRFSCGCVTLELYLVP